MSITLGVMSSLANNLIKIFFIKIVIVVIIVVETTTVRSNNGGMGEGSGIYFVSCHQLILYLFIIFSFLYCYTFTGTRTNNGGTREDMCRGTSTDKEGQ